MGHDLDDEELKAPKNKFYLHVIKNYLVSMKAMFEMDAYFEINSEQTEEFYVAIHELLKENKKQQNEIQELKDEINEMWSHIPRLD